MKTLYYLLLLWATTCLAQPDGALRFQCAVTVANLPLPAPAGPPQVISFAVYGGKWKTDGHPTNCGPNSFRYKTGPILNQTFPFDYSQRADFGAGGSFWFQSTQKQYGPCGVAPFCTFHGKWLWASMVKELDSPSTQHYVFSGILAGIYNDARHNKVKVFADFLQSTVESKYLFDPNGGPQTVVMGSLEVVVTPQ